MTTRTRKEHDIARRATQSVLALAGAGAAALVLASGAFAHAEMSPSDRPREGNPAVHARRPDRGGERLHDPDRADATLRLPDRLVRALARAGSARFSRPAPERTPSSKT